MMARSTVARLTAADATGAGQSAELGFLYQDTGLITGQPYSSADGSGQP